MTTLLPSDALETLPRPTPSVADSERLLAEYGPLVKAMARAMVRRLPANVELDDLEQNGFMGLLSAMLQAARSGVGVQFKAYVAQRVRGAMLDGLRESDPASRQVRRQMRQVERKLNELTYQLGRPPSEGEVAAAMEMELRAYQQLLADADGYMLLSIEDFSDTEPPDEFVDWCASTNSDPLVALERRALQRTLLRALSDLSSRESAVMARYYVDGKTMREVAISLGITEGRVSQIHTQAIARLRAAVVTSHEPKSLLAPRRRTG
jgi:RNA polymerase sigma factor for flagellar operon FliA